MDAFGQSLYSAAKVGTTRVYLGLWQPVCIFQQIFDEIFTGNGQAVFIFKSDCQFPIDWRISWKANDVIICLAEYLFIAGGLCLYCIIIEKPIG